MGKRKMFRGLAVCISVMVVLLLSSVPVNAQKDVLKISSSGALTGPNAVMGRNAKDGMELAIEEINGKGGINGIKIVLFFGDDRVNPGEGVSIAQRNISAENVSVLMTTTGSSVAMSVMAVAQQNRIPSFSPVATSDLITQQGNSWVFRSCPNNTETVVRQVEYIATKLDPKPKSSAALWENTEFGLNLKDVITKYLNKYGVTVVADASHIQDAVEYYSELTKIKSANPDVVVFLGKYTDNGLAVRQAREVGIKAKFSGSNTWVVPDFLKIAGAAAEGSTYPSYFEPSSATPKAKQFVASFRAKYSRDPDWTGSFSYDAIYTIADAVRRAKSTNATAIRDALAKTKGLEGACGITTFDEHGHNTGGKVFMTEIRGGKRVILDF
jgi:branched-chain amino acid transport system substrate-binding protein